MSLSYDISCFINITPESPDWVLSLATDSKIQMNLILKGKRLRIKAKYVHQIALSLYISSSPLKEVCTNQEKCLSMKNLFHDYTENSPRVYYCSDKLYTSSFHFLIFWFILKKGSVNKASIQRDIIYIPRVYTLPD